VGGAPVPPLLTSFQPHALVAAQEAAPQLPRGLLLETLWEGWLDVAQKLDCVAVVCDQVLWTADADVMAGLRAQRRHARPGLHRQRTRLTAQRLWALGIDGLITDRVDLFAPD
jgi:glycerophosphoryl diester phosphodiesterase